MYLPLLGIFNLIKLGIQRKLGKRKMDELDENFIKAIIEKLKERLERNLTRKEFIAFSQLRSGIAYEIILDYISDQNKSKKEIQNYVQNVVYENVH